MGNNLNKFDKELKDIIDGYQPPYSPRAWNRIEKQLHHSYKIWYYIAASMILISISAFVFNTTLNKKESTVRRSEVAKATITNQHEQVLVVNKENKQYSTDQVPGDIEHENNPINIELDQKLINGDSVTESQEVLDNGHKIAENKESQAPLKSMTNNIEKQKEDTSLVKEPKPQIILSSNTGCEPLFVNIHAANLPKDAKLEWSIIDGESLSNSKEFQYQFEKHGLYTVKLNISTSTGIYSVEEEILVKKTPVADFSYSELDGLLELQNTTNEYEDAQWTLSGITTDEDTPKFEMLYSGNYTVSLKVTNDQACSDIKYKTISYKVDHGVFAPNVFSPDGDGLNDEFIVKYKPKDGFKYTLQIFDSSGKKLFETQDNNRGWDGKNVHSKANYEKFLWRLLIKNPRGEVEIKKGSFEML